VDNGIEEIIFMCFDFAAEHVYIPNGTIGPPVAEFEMGLFLGDARLHLFFGSSD
jgi:hypothetical protein